MTTLDKIKPFYYLPYGEAMICLDCRAIYHRSLDACPPDKWTGCCGLGGKPEE